mgnify:CR=1 FL=1
MDYFLGLLFGFVYGYYVCKHLTMRKVTRILEEARRREKTVLMHKIAIAKIASVSSKIQNLEN